MNAQIDITNTVLTTPRLTLHPWRMEDLDDFYEYASQDGVGQMAGWAPHESKEQSETILRHFIEGKITFAITHGGKCIGSLGIERYDESAFPEYDALSCRELGFVLSKDYWGRGLMPEAVERVLSWLFTEIKLDAVFCGYYVWNAQSARVQKKCGFRFCRSLDKVTRMGTVEHAVYNVLSREEWKEALRHRP